MGNHTWKREEPGIVLMNAKRDKNRNRETKQRIVNMASALALFVLLVYSFSNQLFTNDDSVYLLYKSFNWLKIILGGMFVVGGALFLPKLSKSQSLLFALIYFIVIIPRVVTFGVQDRDWLHPFLCFVFFWIAVALSANVQPLSLEQVISEKAKRMLGIALVSAIVLLSVYVIYYLYSTKGMPNLRAFDFSSTYELRAMNSFTKYESYALHALSNNVLPVLLSFVLARDNIKMGLVVSAIQLVLFLWTAYKGWLFSILLVWIAYSILKKRENGQVLLIILPLFIGAVVMLANAFGGNWLHWGVSLFVRRTLLVPSGLGYAYDTFFQENPIVLFAGTVFARLTPMPPTYSTITYTKQIGAIYAGNANANTGLFGSEFAHFGVFGWIAVVLCLVLIAKIIASDRTRDDFLFTSLLGVCIAYQLLSASSLSLIISIDGIAEMLTILVLKSFCKGPGIFVGVFKKPRGDGSRSLPTASDLPYNLDAGGCDKSTWNPAEEVWPRVDEHSSLPAPRLTPQLKS